MLTFETVQPINELAFRLSADLAHYITWRSGEYPLPEDCAFREVIPYYKIPAAVDFDTDLNEQIEPAGWHVQIYRGETPRYYARAYFDSDWTVDWIGEAWLAKAVAAGIEWLESHEAGLPDSKVRLLSSRIFRFSSFWLEDGRHVVISRHWELRNRLPLLQWFSPQALAEQLLHFYGTDYAKGGLRRSPENTAQAG